MFILQMGVLHHISVCQSDNLSVSVSLSQRKNTSSRLEKVFRGFIVNAMNILFWGFYVPDTSQGIQFFSLLFSATSYYWFIGSAPSKLHVIVHHQLHCTTLH